MTGVQTCALPIFNDLGFRVFTPKAAFYIWAGLPAGHTDSIAFAAKLLDETGVVVTPGIGYGPNGEGYVRLSITTPDERIDEALRRLSAWRATRS